MLTWSKSRPLDTISCAYQDVRLALLEIGDDALVSGTGAGGVQIHTGYSSVGEKGFDVIFYFLRAEAAVAQVSALAGGADAGQLVGVATVVAGQLVQPLMVGEADVAVLALGYPAAGVALYHGGEAAAVLKEDDLALFVPAPRGYIEEQWGERTVHLSCGAAP